MNSILSRKESFDFDRLAWLFLMMFLAMVAFVLLSRDSQKQYGAVAFGVFPEFQAIDGQRKAFDHHHLHGQLSVMIVTDQILPQDISLYLHKLSQATSMGKKYLKGIVLTHQAQGISDQWLRYLTLSKEDYQKLNDWKENKFKGDVILVDQNGVIRGVFDLWDNAQRLNFEGAVKGIL